MKECMVSIMSGILLKALSYQRHQVGLAKQLTIAVHDWSYESDDYIHNSYLIQISIFFSEYFLVRIV